MKLVELLERKNNNLDFIRVIAATLVIWNHSYVLSPLPNVSSKAVTGIAVPLFGFISGLVITNSVLNKKNALNFLVSIFFRLWIPLAISVLACALILGPSFSEYNAITYFKDFFNDIYKFIYNNLLFNINYRLPGFFLENRYSSSINGSIWVIPLFFGSYLFILALKLLGLLKDDFKGFLVSIVVILLAIAVYYIKIPFVWSNFNTFCILVSILFGCSLCCLRNILNITFRLVVGTTILYFLFRKTALVYLFKLLMIFIGCLYLSQNRWFLFLKPKINISLGLFLYSYPVQQAMSCLYKDSTPLFNFVSSFTITIILSFMSYYFIEKYCYRFAALINRFIDKHNIVL